MAKSWSWDSYGRKGLDIAHSASTLGFSAAKVSTRLGFSVARSLATAVVGLTTTAVDLTLFGGSTVTRPICGLAVSTVLTLAEQITLAPIHLSEYITTTSLLAAHSSINALSVIFPGSSEAAFSLVSFIDLVRREWSQQTDDGSLPEKQYGITQVARAIVGWVVLQGVTQQWQERRWLKYLKEMDIKDPPKIHDSEPRTRKSSYIRVISDVIFPGQQGPQIIAADIGEPELACSRASSIYLSRTKSHISLNFNIITHAADTSADPPSLTNAEVKATLRRLSKMVLAGYGGASLLFFGVSPSAFGNGASSSIPSSSPTSFSAAIAREKTVEEANLTNAVDASEAETAGDGEFTGNSVQEEYAWWDVLLGKHDQEIFERSTAHVDDSLKDRASSNESYKGDMKATAVIGQEHLMPRFWVLTDHSRAQIVLVIRGTMSLNEIAVDLTCDAEAFQPASTPPSTEQDDHLLSGQFAFPSISEKEVTQEETTDEPEYHVHGGMLKMAKLMGDVGKPVQLAVLDALQNNPDYELVLCGHSLGAGVAAILGMTWADPRTCLTVPSSGLPVDRRVYVYCFGPPALTDAALSRLTNKLIVSIVYSHDVVSRLSLGSIRDLKNAAMWLCEANEAGDGREGWSAIMAHAKRWKEDSGSKDDMNWFIAMRKTLEASMRNSNMYPPGRVLWAMRDKDLHQAHQLKNSQIPDGQDKLRVFEVLDVENVFSQLVFARNMLTAHLPHQYDQVLRDLL